MFTVTVTFMYVYAAWLTAEYCYCVHTLNTEYPEPSTKHQAMRMSRVKVMVNAMFRELQGMNRSHLHLHLDVQTETETVRTTALAISWWHPA